jgi:YD repeat-containing protein
MKKIGLAILFCFNCFYLAAQNGNMEIAPVRVIGPNPEAAKIAQYGAYSISYYTGKPEISVPLHTIQTADLSLPISLIYESTGMKPDDLASWVGTGWMLGGIGCVTREVVGMPDELQGGYLSQTQIPYNNPNINLDYYSDVVHYRTKDTEPDRYYFSFKGHYGEFTYDTFKNIVQIPLSGVRIRSLANRGFEITDEEGTLYEFTYTETTEITINADDDYLPQSTTSWWLTKITSADGSDVINFYYSKDLAEIELRPHYTAGYGPTYQFLPATPPSQFPTLIAAHVDYTQSVLHREYQPARIDSITFTNGKLVFNRVTDRQDLGSARLSSIDVYGLANNTMQKQRSFNFLTSYFTYTGFSDNSLVYYSSLSQGKKRLKLTGLEERKADGTLNGTYGFTYDESHVTPFRGSLQQDYWGYYNGAASNDDQYHTLIPAQTTPDNLYQVGGANRESDADYMKVGMLTKIKYPTGGSTAFNWEAHKYVASGTTSVTHSTGILAAGNNSGNTPQPTQSTIISIPVADPNATVTTQITTYLYPSPPYDDPTYQEMQENTRPNVSIKNMTTGQIIYSNVNNNPSAQVLATTGINLPAGQYQLTANCFSNTTSAFASVTIQYHTIDSVQTVKLAGGLRIADISNYDADNKLLSKDTYKYGANESGNGSLALSPFYMNVQSYPKRYQYNYLSPLGQSCLASNTDRIAYRSEPVLSFSAGSAVIYPVVTKYKGDAVNNSGKSIYYYNYKVGDELQVDRFPDGNSGEYMVTKLGWRTPVISKEEHYKNESGAYKFVKTVENTYDDFGYRSFPVLKLGFRNEMVALTSCYQPDVYTFYAAIYNVYTGKTQLIASSVKEYDPTGNTSLETQKTFSYDTTYRSFLTTETLVNSKGETEKSYLRYPFQKTKIVGLSAAKGVVLDTMVARNMLATVIQQEDSINTRLISRKTNKYKIWDAATKVVKPDSVYLKLLSQAEDARLVFDSYDGKGNLLQQSGTYDTKDVFVWGYNYEYPVAKITGSDYNTVIALLDTTIIQRPTTDAALRTELNKLRTATALKSAQVFTYTYLPGVGISSVTDPAGRTSYYEYDGMQRLRLVRDQDGKILRVTDYQYSTYLTH